ncbi:SCO1860 family LAETG-anchored protein [Streptomyces sp. DSM 42041]|uniref:SCO1860 family LAETG-anchored protein n=1 Tax=Streptomyces hazeniae TaxID=3075538 RepID=A0ABU2NW48_9ACTN|nr:SCO1860 family LAETG-anchored protein [Streptomyces sp. DSM 42041]MDT0379833.1 SCO1860 family LAETG-anchored protein [Streptomyces sp. DSM 42041]
MNTAVRSLLAAAVLAAAGTAPAHATGSDDGRRAGDEGAASATVLRAALDVGLLNKTVDVPLTSTLNEVTTRDGGGTERRTALTARLDGVQGGEPFSVLQAQVADAEAGHDASKSWGAVTLADARVHVPGLPLLSVVELEKVTARVECAAGERPAAEANVLGSVRALGKRVTLTAGGPTVVTVPGVGEVRLELSRTDRTSRTAAATALELSVEVDPLDLGVAEVAGTLTVAEATCTAPPAPRDEPEPEAEEEPDPQTQTVPGEKRPAGPELAATGGDPATHYLVGGAAVLLVAGAATVFALRRRG